MEETPSALRRSATLPCRVASIGRYSLGSHELMRNHSPSEEILYSSPSAKIFKFELPNSSSSEPILPDLDYPVDAIETLPWKLSTERIASIGSLKIENVAGSATFLKSGSVVYPLLKNSQCWCVDQVSRFVFRIRKLTYYRVELPNETEEDIQRVESFKEVLSSIIRYEITPCPFKRGFSVVLPEEARTPKKKKAWQPKRQSMPAFHSLHMVAENTPTSSTTAVTTSATAPTASDDSSGSGSTSETGDDERLPNPGANLSDRQAIPNIKIRDESSIATDDDPFVPVSRGMRRVTAPPHTFQSLIAKFQEFEDTSGSRRPSLTGNADRMSSFGSYHTCETDVSSSPLDTQYVDPFSSWDDTAGELQTAVPSVTHGEADSTSPVSQSRSDSFIESGNNPRDLLEDASPVDRNHLSEPSRSNLYERERLSPDEAYSKASSPVIDETNSDLRQRLRVNRKRELSPLPPSSTLYYPSARSPANHLTQSILRKTCIYVLGPPVQFIKLLLYLAARVAIDRPLPTSSDSVNTDDLYHAEVDEASEDDYGIPIVIPPSIRRVNLNSFSAYDSLDEAD